jgi:hypothetical protein
MTASKKGQKLTVSLGSITKGWNGVYDIDVLINGKKYTFFITSEFAVRKVKQLIKRRKPGKALHTLKLFNTREVLVHATAEESNTSQGKEDSQDSVASG